MSIWTVEKIKEFYSHLNLLYNLNVNPDIIVEDKNKFPLRRRNFKNLVFVPEFFNHELITEEVRIMTLLRMYASLHSDKNMDGHPDVHYGFLAKGLCEDLKFDYIAEAECEAQARAVRRILFDDIENGCFFSKGNELRESSYQSYEVVDICRKSKTETDIIVKPIGCHLGEPNKIFTEEELYYRCCNFFDFDKIIVDMRRNLFVLSGPLGAGKKEVFKQLQQYCPNVNKTISVTTRAPLKDEKDCVDYYFVSIGEFYDYQMERLLVENRLYNTDHYGTLFTEIERYKKDTPLFLITDVRNRREVLAHYPLAKTIFIQPESFEKMETRLRKTGKFSEAEIVRRLSDFSEEMEQKDAFDYVLTNFNTEVCAKGIEAIIKENMQF